MTQPHSTPTNPGPGLDPRQLTHDGQTQPADWLDLTSWALGYTQGWDTATHAHPQQQQDSLAVSLAETTDSQITARGRQLREQQIQREQTEAATHATPPRQTPDWPPITHPGTAG